MERILKITRHVHPAAPAMEAGVAPTECAGTMGKAPIRVCVTGAAGQIGYALLFRIASGAMFGEDQPVILHLLDIPPAMKALGGVEMELNDCAFPLVHGIVATADAREGFRGVDVALLVGARPRGPGMVRADLLKANANIFKVQGKVLNEVASRNVKVLVVGNPANTNALIAAEYAPDIPRENFTALTRLDQNRARNQIATKLGVNVAQVQNVIIWGNHSKTQYPDVNHAVVANFPVAGHATPVRAAVNDDAWLHGAFIKTVQQRGAAIIKARKLSSAASAANAIVDHMRSWWCGTAPGEVVSMGVPSDGSYGIPKGVIYSFPVTCANAEYSIVQGLPISKFSAGKMKATAQELFDERKMALGN